MIIWPQIEIIGSTVKVNHKATHMTRLKQAGDAFAPLEMDATKRAILAWHESLIVHPDGTWTIRTKETNGEPYDTHKITAVVIGGGVVMLKAEPLFMAAHHATREIELSTTAL